MNNYYNNNQTTIELSSSNELIFVFFILFLHKRNGKYLIPLIICQNIIDKLNTSHDFNTVISLISYFELYPSINSGDLYIGVPTLCISSSLSFFLSVATMDDKPNQQLLIEMYQKYL